MTLRLELHPMAGTKRAGELAQLVESLHRAGRRAVVWVADPGRRQALDDFLWTYDQQSFVPHVIYAEPMDTEGETIVLVGEPVNPIGAEHLVVADDLPPADWVRTFAVVHDLIPPGPEGADRTAWWESVRDGGDGGGS